MTGQVLGHVTAQLPIRMAICDTRADDHFWLRLISRDLRLSEGLALVAATQRNLAPAEQSSSICAHTVSCLFYNTVWVKKNPPWDFLTFFPKRLGMFSPNFTHLFTFLSTLDYKFYPIIFNCDEVVPHQVRPPSVRFNRWWTLWAYNGGRA